MDYTLVNQGLGTEKTILSRAEKTYPQHTKSSGVLVNNLSTAACKRFTIHSKFLC